MVRTTYSIGLAGMGKGAQIIAMAASHHRLANIHPFPEGNLIFAISTGKLFETIFL
jgi:fido (protein-threonine AMPylation protein)